VAGATLFVLENKTYPSVGDSAADASGFVADDGEDVSCRNYPGGRGYEMR
jgi:hypothetical protein